MKIHTIIVKLRNGDVFTRCEWGRTREQAKNTLRGIYGENILALA